MSSLSTSDRITVSHRHQRTPVQWAGGTVFDVVLDGDASAGALALLDQSGVRGDATPLHVHRDAAEVFYVLEGSARAWHLGTTYDLEAGSAVYLPAGQEHAFVVTSERARILTVTTPAGFADFVREAGLPVDDAHPRELDVGRLLAAAGRHGIDITGPPPTGPAGG